MEVGRTALTGAGLADVKLGKGVEPADNYAKVGGAFVAVSAANVRSAPGLDGAILGKLAQGQRV
ncbi:SH3 domain-containing protein, partial [Lacticaseibacillus paracasei]